MVAASFIERYLWTPTPPTTEIDESQSISEDSPAKDDSAIPTFKFSKAVLTELNSLIALAFSKAEKARASAGSSDESVSPEKSVVLSCTYKEGMHIIDEAVKQVAAKQKADVLVLDALELAAGKLGLLGQDAEVIDEIYASVVEGSTPETETKKDGEESEEASAPTVPDESKPTLSTRARQLVDALLNVNAPRQADSEETAPLSAPSRRIIYMRDFQTITAVAKPLLTYILQSLHASRSPNSSDPVSDSTSDPAAQPGPTRTTILVFGSTTDRDPLTIGNAPSVSQKDSLFLNCLFTHSRTILTGRKTSGCTCSSCQPWTASSPKAELEKVPFNEEWGKRVDDLGTNKLAMTLFATNVKSGATDEAWQKESNQAKIKKVNEWLLKACFVREHGSIEEEVSAKVIEKGDADTLLEVEDADSIVTIALGLIASASLTSQEEESGTTPSLRDHVSEAYKTFQRRKKDKKDWESGVDVNEVEAKKDENDDDSDEEEEKEEPKPPKDTYSDVEGHAKDLLPCIIDTDEITTTFSDVFVDDAIMDSLQTIVTLPLLYPNYFNTGVLAKEAIGGILLYGPPGTGKTMLCRALAKTSHAKMLHIKPSDINDKWVGESEKKVTAVFELAHRLAPCIVFIDEIDSLFSSRNDCTKSWERNILTEFMQGMDGLRSAKKNRDNNIVIVGATNRPFDLDLAVLRRLPRRILVDMPNLEMRKGIIGSYLKDETLDGVDMDQLALETDGFSGSDLKNLCVAAALNSVKEAIGPEWKKRGKPPVKEPKESKKSKKSKASTSSTTEESAPSTEGAAEGNSEQEDEAKGGETEEAAEVKEGEAKEGEKKEVEKKEEDKEKDEFPPRRITAANIRQARADISRSITGTKNDELYRWHQRNSSNMTPVAAAPPAKPASTSGSPLNPGYKPNLGGSWNRWAKAEQMRATKAKPSE